MFVLQILQDPLGIKLNKVFSLTPRTVRGLLLGVPCSPLMHGSWLHLAGNMTGWFTIGLQVLREGIPAFICSLVAVALGGGGLLWLIGRSGSTHVGLSGVLYGFWGFLMASVPLKQPFSASRLIRVLVVGAIYTPFNFLQAATPAANTQVSWEGHLYGLVAGVVWAMIYFRAWTLHGTTVGGYRSWLFEHRVWVPVASLPPALAAGYV